MTITLARAGTIFVSGTANVITDGDVFLYIDIDGVQAGVSSYTNLKNTWVEVPFSVMRNTSQGEHTVKLRANANGSNARIGTRVLNVMSF